MVPVGGGGSALRRAALRIGFFAAFEPFFVAAFFFGAAFFLVAAFFFVAFFFAIRRAPLLSDVFAPTT
jgi:hypothetical protein